MIEELFLNMGGVGVALLVMWDNNKRFAKTLDKHTTVLTKLIIRVEECPKKKKK